MDLRSIVFYGHCNTLKCQIFIKTVDKFVHGLWHKERKAQHGLNVSKRLEEELHINRCERINK